MLDIENLHIAYGSVEAIQDVSLSLNQGEIVTVLGANGAGKSTLLRAISGITPVKSGNITFEETALNTLPADEIVRRGISHAPEGRRVFATLTVEENLALGAYTHKKEKERVQKTRQRVLQLFPILVKRRKQLAGTLSGGEQQMLAMGRALMSEPRLLLLDEPSLGLSPMYVKLIFSIIREINSQGVAVLLVEQNARKALAVANRGYVLETGAMMTSGPAADLRQDQKVQEAYLGGAAVKKRA
ncbi:MAG: ABC transporter ATP-binding protein [Deltaproteobacteria bacterium]|nr:ABC transporter ATP-binding protein [Deltaproteobacteria bacterium]